ncbi:hypothetical protein ACOSQ4_006940 [Xanthoceras sorbifolium]
MLKPFLGKEVAGEMEDEVADPIHEAVVSLQLVDQTLHILEKTLIIVKYVERRITLPLSATIVMITPIKRKTRLAALTLQDNTNVENFYADSGATTRMTNDIGSMPKDLSERT